MPRSLLLGSLALALVAFAVGCGEGDGVPDQDGRDSLKQIVEDALDHQGSGHGRRGCDGHHAAAGWGVGAPAADGGSAHPDAGGGDGGDGGAADAGASSSSGSSGEPSDPVPDGGASSSGGSTGGGSSSGGSSGGGDGTSSVR